MFDILQGDMTRSKVILTFTCLKMYIARSGDTSGSRTTLFVFGLFQALDRNNFLLLLFLSFSVRCQSHCKPCDAPRQCPPEAHAVQVVSTYSTMHFVI